MKKTVQHGKRKGPWPKVVPRRVVLMGGFRSIEGLNLPDISGC